MVSGILEKFGHVKSESNKEEMRRFTTDDG